MSWSQSTLFRLHQVYFTIRVGFMLFFLLILQAHVWRRYGVLPKTPGPSHTEWLQWCRLQQQHPGMCHLPSDLCPPRAPPLPPRLLFPVRQRGLLARQALCPLPSRHPRGLPGAPRPALTRGAESGCRRESVFFFWGLCVVLWGTQWLVAVWWEDHPWAGGGLP